MRVRVLQKKKTGRQNGGKENDAYLTNIRICRLCLKEKRKKKKKKRVTVFCLFVFLHFDIEGMSKVKTVTEAES